MRHAIAVAAVALGLATPAAAQAAPMIIYEAGRPIPQDQLMDLGPPEALGGTVLSGDPHISARIDYAQDGVLGGVFQATPGDVQIHFPFTEHATILDGAVTLTDQSGNTATLRKGDSYLIRQGSDITWRVSGSAVQKSFFNRVEGADAPAPMLIYRKGDAVPQDQLMDLGPPEGLGGTVLAGDPHISARIDYADGPALGGVFQATRGDVLIHFPFTEHATVLNHAVTLTDDTGQRFTMKAGDAYLIRKDSEIVWQVGESRVQKSFLNVS